MAFTTTTSESWIGRLGKSIAGIGIGIILFILAIILLAWNENRAVKTAAGLKEGSGAVISLESTTPASANDGKLVHVTGEATTTETLSDSQFQVSVIALKLKRTAEMYQWKEESKSETKTKLGGGTETVTTYTYGKVWSSELISSSNFKESGHENPANMAFDSKTVTAGTIKLGEFKLTDGLVSQINQFDALPVPEVLPAGFTAVGEILYKSKTPDSPTVGDLRVSFSQVKPAEVSVVAAQRDGLLEPYHTKADTKIEMLDYGNQPATKMFEEAVASNIMMTWILRGGGFLLVFIGCQLVLGPLSVAADVLPFLGGIARFGATLISMIISVPVTLITIAVAWLAVRPIIGITLLVVGIGVPVALLVMRKNKGQATAAA